MAVAPGEDIRLRVDRLSYGGRGVARLDGLVVFVDDAAPGDLVQARVRRLRRNFAEAEVVRVEEPSPHRVTPRCPHFGPCGGCLWQHVDYRAQVQAKEMLVRESLERLGGLRDLPVRPIMAMEEPWYYRNKMEFAFHPPDRLGLHRRGRWDELEDLHTCYLQSPQSAAIVRRVREFVQSRAIPCFDPGTHTGFLRHLVIREGKSTGERMVAVVTAPGPFADARDLAATLVGMQPDLTSVMWAVNPSRSDALEVEELHVLHGRAYIVERLRDLTFRLGLQTFFQTNTAQAERMIDVVRAMAGLTGGESVVDLYCGVGTFALALAGRARAVTGVETVPAAVEAARENAAGNGAAHAQFVTADARRFMAALAPGGRPDVLVLDPPRAGAGARVMREIGRLGPARVIYVSCNPTTLAPDLRALLPFGYRVTSVQPVDLFPQTYHVECIVSLDRTVTP